MSSYQDIDSRLGVVERKIDFLMSLASVTKRVPNPLSLSGYSDQKLSLTDLYRELSSEGAVIEAETVNG